MSKKKEAAILIQQTIKGIKAEYRATEKKIQASGMSHVTIDANSVIKACCKKNGVNESAIRTIGGWQNLKTASKMSFVNDRDE